MKHATIFTRLAQRADPNIPILEAAMAEIANLQAKIDRLMFEYCPDEMTPEQMEEWGKHQVTVEQRYFCEKCGYRGDNTIHDRPGTPYRCDYMAWETVRETSPQQVSAEPVKPLHYSYETVVKLQAEWVEKIAALEAENKRLKTDLSNCDGELAHYQADVAQQAEENTRLLQANHDCIDHFEALKEDFDKQAERIKELETILKGVPL